MKYLLTLLSLSLFHFAPIQEAPSTQAFRCDTFKKVLSDSIISDYLGIVKNYYEEVDSVIVIDMDSVLDRTCMPRRINDKTVRYYYGFLPRMVSTLNTRAYRQLKGKRTIVLHVREVPQTASSPSKRKYSIWQLNTNMVIEIEQGKNGSYKLVSRGVY